MPILHRLIKVNILNKRAHQFVSASHIYWRWIAPSNILIWLGVAREILNETSRDQGGDERESGKVAGHSV